MDTDGHGPSDPRSTEPSGANLTSGGEGTPSPGMLGWGRGTTPSPEPIGAVSPPPPFTSPLVPPPVPPPCRRRRFRGLWEPTHAGTDRRISKGVWMTGAVVLGLGVPVLGLAVWLRWGPPLWPEPLAGVNIFPISTAPMSVALTDDNAMTHLWRLKTARTAWNQIPGSERTLWRARGWEVEQCPGFEQAWRVCDEDRLHWERAAAAPRVVYFEVESIGKLGPMFDHVLAMASLECARAEQLARAGRWDEADATLERTLRIGSRLSQGGSALQVRVGWAVEEEVLRTLRHMAAWSTHAIILGSWQARLGHVRPHTQELAEALRYETVFLFEVVHRIYAKLHGHTAERGAVARRALLTVLARLGSTPAQTHRHLMGVTTHWIGSVVPEHRARADRDALNRLRRWVRFVPWLADDPVAACLVRQFLAEPAVMEARAHEMDRTVSATRYVLAVRMFQLEHGRLPSAWSEVVARAPDVRGDGSWSLVVTNGVWAIHDGQRVWGPLEFVP